MSLLRATRFGLGRSLYVSALLATVMILSLSFLVFKSISDQLQKTRVDVVYDSMDELQIETARTELAVGGKPALQQYMQTLDRIFQGSHSLLDASGRDILTGEDQSSLLPSQTVRRGIFGGRWVLAHRSQDGQYWLFAVRSIEHAEPWMFLPYYFLLIGSTSILCWLVAIGVVSPLRKIAGGMARFGEGELETRVAMKRDDEIGQLARSFNKMAERLGVLIESERTLLSDISHELRSPLARMKVAIKLARSSDDKGASLDRIERDVDRLASIVSDVVEISLVEGDPALKERDLVDLQEIVDAVVLDCRIEAKVRDCWLEVTGKLTHPVEGNPELLRRAIENVTRNAVRYAPDKSSISITLTESNGTAVVSVRDMGVGVPESALGRIFDPFFRVETARDARSGGSGLGLSIARRAVLLHRGEIVAHNASPGLMVTIRIPMRQLTEVTAR
jgi:signal transduction histidine kinase